MAVGTIKSQFYLLSIYVLESNVNKKNSSKEDETVRATKRSEYDSDDEERDDAELSNSSPEDIEDYPVRARNNTRAKKAPPKRSATDRKKKR